MTSFGTRKIAPNTNPETPVAQPVPEPQELRSVPEVDQRHPRRRMLKRGIASYAEGGISMDVTVRDMSETGARVQHKDGDFIPDHFQLFVELDSVRVDCAVVWRNGSQMGCRFASAVEAVSTTRIQSLQSSSTGKVSILRKKPIV